jgi:CBS domain-containing protein
MKVKDVMTPAPEGMQSRDSLRAAAAKMRALDVGALPVYSGNKLQGIVTDRDIVVRAIAADLSPATTAVGEILTAEVVRCSEETGIQEAAQMMEDHRVRRLLVTDRRGTVTGIVSLGDLAHHMSRELSAEVLKGVSQPVGPNRS